MNTETLKQKIRSPPHRSVRAELPHTAPASGTCREAFLWFRFVAYFTVSARTVKAGHKAMRPVHHAAARDRRAWLPVPGYVATTQDRKSVV